MQDKAWELGGEVSGKRRPENSLLEVDAEWETVRQAAPEVRFDAPHLSAPETHGFFAGWLL